MWEESDSCGQTELRIFAGLDSAISAAAAANHERKRAQHKKALRELPSHRYSPRDGIVVVATIQGGQ
jgi:hypothetical protein